MAHRGSRTPGDESLTDSLSFVLDAAGLGWWDMDIERDQTSRSPSHDALFGHTEMLDSWGYENFLAHVHPGDRDRVDATYQRALEGHGDYAAEFRVVWPDSSVHWVFSRGRFLLAEDGTARRVAGVMGDITERKEQELASLEKQAQAAAMLESTGDAVIGTTLDGRITSFNQSAETLYGWEAEEVVGAQLEVLLPPDDRGELRAAIAMVQHRTTRELEGTHVRRGGGDVEVSLTVSPVTKDNHIIGASVIGRDIAARRRAERALAHQALHDELTGLPNRALLGQRLMQAITDAARTRRHVAVLFLDIDEFKVVNDAAGHLVGDRILVEIAQRLLTTLDRGDTLARFGGDEFVVVRADGEATSALRLADRMHRVMESAVDVDAGRFHLDASIGVAVADPADSADATPAELGDVIIRRADTAMYDAKAGGRGRTSLFDQRMGALVRDRLELGRDLREALATDGLELCYQPIVDLRTGAMIGVEALCRWPHPSRGRVDPGTFIDVAERSGLITDLDRWTLRRASRDAAVMRQHEVLPPGGRVAVNISATDLTDGILPAMVRETVPEEDRSALTIEITETSVMADPERARRELEAITAMGVALAIDDFGTGQSALAYLRRVPAAVLKIDRSFVTHMPDGPADRAILTSIVELARATGLVTVAEGVETPAQADALRDMGCDAAQGFLWSGALPLEDLIVFADSLPREDALRR